MTTVNIQNGTIFMARDWLEYSSNPNLLAFSLDKAAVQEETADTHGGGHLLNADQDILWIDKMKRVGLKVRVKRGRSNRPMPFVATPHEPLPLHYEVEIEGTLYLFPFEGSCILTVDYRSPRSICLSTLRI
jgi:hypothetical protein